VKYPELRGEVKSYPSGKGCEGASLPAVPSRVFVRSITSHHALGQMVFVIELVSFMCVVGHCGELALTMALHQGAQAHSLLLSR
jgi:hypothetical protein